ncbi:hypothetical protein TSUD_96710 [Trifolium subterraneum]|nr:hypothetical protein TSUD_96710 [Trifolium subterraneum]
MDIMNRACIMKMGWELQQGSNDLWSKVIRGKCARETSCRVIGNGHSTQAWDMCWIAPGLHIVNLEIDIPIEMRNACILDLVKENGCWNWDYMNWIPHNILNKIIAIPPPAYVNGDDLSFWPHSKHVHFSIVSAYNMLTKIAHVEEDDTWKRIWKLQVPKRGNSGDWLGGFVKGSGECSVMVAKLWGALKGLKLAWERGYKKVEL